VKRPKPQNPNYKAVIHDCLERQFFMKHIGLELVDILPGKVSAALEVKAFHKQQHYILHGGVVSTIADVVMGFAAYTLIKEGQAVVTSSLNVQYIKPGKGNLIKAEATVVKPGNLLYYCEADIWSFEDGEKVLIAKAQSTMCTINLQKKLLH
jgi:uncharacterized protein (TIGR00369 family)